MEGVQVNLGYRRRFPIGTIGLNVNYFYRDKLETKVGTGDIDHIAGEIGYPRHAGTDTPCLRAGSSRVMCRPATSHPSAGDRFQSNARVCQYQQ